MPEKLSFVTNFPVTVTFSKKPSDWFGELSTHEEYGDSYRYKFIVTASDKYAGGPHVGFFTPILHELIGAAGVERGHTIDIEKSEDPEDTRKKVWKIVRGGVVYTSKGGQIASSQETKPGPEPPSPPPSRQPGETAPAIPPDAPEQPPPPPGNGHTRPNRAPVSFAEVCALSVKCLRAAPINLKLGGVFPSPERILTEGHCLFIRCGFLNIRPKESDVQAYIEEAKKLYRAPPPTTPADKPPPEVPRPPDAEDNDPVSGEDLFDLYQQAKDAGIEEPVFEFMVRQLMAVQLRTRHMPEKYPLSNCPKSLVPHIVDWISANAVTLDELSQTEEAPGVAGG